jgi:hypothetical protein
MGGVELLVQFVAREIELSQLGCGDPDATQDSDARSSAAYMSFMTARSPKACGITFERRRSSPKSRSKRLVVLAALRCVKGNFGCAVQAAEVIEEAGASVARERRREHAEGAVG